MVPKTFQGKNNSEPCSQLFKRNELRQIKKTASLSCGKKRRNKEGDTVIRDAENLGLVPKLEMFSEKINYGSGVSQNNKVFDTATYKRGKFGS